MRDDYFIKKNRKNIGTGEIQRFVCKLFTATGTNASYMEDSSRITYGLSTASEPYPYPQMIIDTEWGGFGDRNEAEYILTQYDKIIDSRSEHPGVNVFVTYYLHPFEVFLDESLAVLIVC